jgi:hypothetical protein
MTLHYQDNSHLLVIKMERFLSLANVFLNFQEPQENKHKVFFKEAKPFELKAKVEF